LKLGNELVYERGRLSLLDSPEIKEIAARYPDRPGV
jgi:hypothetical protein